MIKLCRGTNDKKRTGDNELEEDQLARITNKEIASMGDNKADDGGGTSCTF